MQESIYEPVISKLKRRMERCASSDPLDKNTDVGAINSQQQLEKIKELVAAGEAEGAEIYQPPCRLPERRWFFAPTVFTNVAQSYRIAQEEIFGPVLSVLTFRTPDEAIEKANNTPYGLSAGVWTEKGSRILSMAQRLRAGVIWANTYNRFDPSSPFGGYRESGFGHEGGLHASSPTSSSNEPRLPIKKTYKLYVGGAFPRSESGTSSYGRARAMRSRPGRTCATRYARPARRSRSGRRQTAYNRGGPLPRGRDHGGAACAVHRLTGGRRRSTASSTRGRYAGWADKLSQVLGSSNPVAGPYFTSIETDGRGEVGGEGRLEGLVLRLAPAIVGGNAAVVVASERRPLAAITLAEVLATSDVPGGVVNILTGRKTELVSVLAGHMDVNALDLAGVDGDRTELERLAAENVKRVVRNGDGQSPWRAAAFLELKTIRSAIGV